MKVGNNATHSTPHAACLIPDTSRTLPACLSLSPPPSLFLTHSFYYFNCHSFSPCQIECARSPLVAIIHKVMNMASLIGT